MWEHVNLHGTYHHFDLAGPAKLGGLRLLRKPEGGPIS
jgi:hypothetical protein